MNDEVKAAQGTELAPVEQPAGEQPEVNVVVEVTPVATKEEYEALAKTIGDGFDQYFAGKQAAHLAMVAAVVFAAKYGDAVGINIAFEKCGGFMEKPGADAENIRSWCKLISTYAVNDKGQPQTWLGFNAKASEGKKAGFFVKSGREFLEARNKVDELELKQGPRFMDRVAKSSKGLSMEDILRLMSKFSDTVISKEKKVLEAGSTPLPEGLKRKLLEMSAEATVVMAQSKTVEKSA